VEVKQTGTAVTWLTVALPLHLELIVPLKLGSMLISTSLVIYECSNFNSEHFPCIKPEENSLIKIFSLYGKPTHTVRHYPGTR